MDLSDELLRAAEQFGSQWHCSPALHPDDHLMAHWVTYSPLTAKRGLVGGLSEFFEDGAKDARQINDITARMEITRAAAVLEFACGYGRVSRHMAHHFSDLTCADIHPGAVGFLHDRMGLNAILSTAAPQDFQPGRTFDFIFVLSLFSHLPDHLFGPWLKRLYDLLNPGGVLMFTTHGEASVAYEPLLAKNLDRQTGYGFLEISDQRDLDFSIYGSTTALAPYVKKKIAIATQSDARIDFAPSTWWRVMQDQWIVQKPHVNLAST